MDPVDPVLSGPLRDSASASELESEYSTKIIFLGVLHYVSSTLKSVGFRVAVPNPIAFSREIVQIDVVAVSVCAHASEMT